MITFGPIRIENKTAQQYKAGEEGRMIRIGIPEFCGGLPDDSLLIAL